MAVKITFRPTPRQVLGRTIFIAAIAGAAALTPALAYMVLSGDWNLIVLAAVAAVAGLVAFAFALLGSRKLGVVVDDEGIHPFESPRSVPWTQVADIRAERRGTRAVPVVYLTGPAGGTWRLRAPYSGRALAVDEQLDEKIFVMRTLWEVHRHGAVPPRTD
ncbi:hypothetical protein [Glycomyces buryatensis]|uniref:PH domain-containing protein n=1 Tax=Glycomyces buryatensis TaxID=2570927 RepID=A0A4S8Q7D6_9ACTN|nr:hypothetical protein [Glycomyces buryatensis]THV38632.1 hypothetical protein FAB82_19575 [Glycomyces buryatensis]